MTKRSAVLGCALLAAAGTAPIEWFLLSRDGKCAEVMTLSRKVEDLKPFIGPEDFVWQMRERGLEVEAHTHQLEEMRAVEVRVPKKELALMFVPKQACREFLRK